MPTAVPDPAIRPLPFVLLTGFLGSGKTTLLNRILADPSMGDTAVLINEFGAIGLDHLLVASVTDDVVLLESGCVCCSVGDDLGAALATLLERRRAGELPPFRRVVLETSGIADPGPIQQRILADPQLAPQLRIEGVVTVVDALLGECNLERHPECTTQVAVADRLVVSKLDLVTADQRQALITHLRALNPHASLLLPGADGPMPEDLLGNPAPGGRADWFTPAPDHGAASGRPGGSAHAERYATFSLRWNQPLDWEDFRAWVEDLLLARGDSILRMKGLLHVHGEIRPVVVQGVQHSLYPPARLSAWPDGGPRTEIVFITRDFPREAAELSFRQFFGPGDAAPRWS